MYFPWELLHGDGGVFLGALGALSKHFKGLRTSSALSLPRASQWERCQTGIISSSEENNMIMDTFFCRFWAESGGSGWHLVLFCIYENQTSGDSLLLLWKRQMGHSLTVNTNLQSWYVGQLGETQDGLFFCLVKKGKELKWLEKKGNEGKERNVFSLEKEGSYIFKKQRSQRLRLCEESLCLTMEGKQGLLGPKCNVTSELETG